MSTDFYIGILFGMAIYHIIFKTLFLSPKYQKLKKALDVLKDRKEE